MKSIRIGAALISAGLALSMAQAASADSASCKQGCNTKHMTCMQGGKSDDVCLPQWQQCKTTCAGGVRSVSALAAPVKVTTTTMITPTTSGAKVVATKTKISH
ncbi:hypothetical protein BH09PSE2_BH09PSE2_23020 [soil metagenome]